MKTELWPLERLIDYARNPRKNDHAVDRVAAAIKEFGFRVPIIAKSDGLVVDGHLRLKAARKLGLVEVPVVLADDLTDAQVKAFRISVNRMAELAEWDNELLALELGELGELGFDLDLTGFASDEINVLLNGWKSDIGSVEQHGDEMEAIGAVLRVKIATSDRAAASEAIENALQVAGVSYELA